MSQSTQAGQAALSDNRIARAFAKLRSDGRKAFIAYICAGDPHLDATVELVVAMADSGVDIIELGIPYSGSNGRWPSQSNGERTGLGSWNDAGWSI